MYIFRLFDHIVLNFLELWLLEYHCGTLLSFLKFVRMCLYGWTNRFSRLSLTDHTILYNQSGFHLLAFVSLFYLFIHIFIHFIWPRIYPVISSNFYASVIICMCPDIQFSAQSFNRYFISDIRTFLHLIVKYKLFAKTVRPFCYRFDCDSTK